MEHVDDLTVQYEDEGEVVIEELDKVILSKGSWATILYKYRQWDQRKNEMSAVKYTIRRYQKRNGAYRQQAKFNISSAKQAQGLVEALSSWVREDLS